MQPAFGAAAALSTGKSVTKWGCAGLAVLIVFCAVGWFIWTATHDDTPPDYGDVAGQVD